MSTNENDSLGGFDVWDFLSALDSDVRSGKKIGDASGPQSLENELTEAEKEELRRYQVKFLSNSFSSIDGLTRELAEKFKSIFDSRKNAASRDTQLSPKDRRFITETTIDSLAQTALEEHNTFVQLSGRAVPQSPDAEGFQEQAFRWEKIHAIVKAASEIRD